MGLRSFQGVEHLLCEPAQLQAVRDRSCVDEIKRVESDMERMQLGRVRQVRFLEDAARSHAGAAKEQEAIAGIP